MVAGEAEDPPSYSANGGAEGLLRRGGGVESDSSTRGWVGDGVQDASSGILTGGILAGGGGSPAGLAGLVFDQADSPDPAVDGGHPNNEDSPHLFGGSSKTKNNASDHGGPGARGPGGRDGDNDDNGVDERRQRTANEEGVQIFGPRPPPATDAVSNSGAGSSESTNGPPQEPQIKQAERKKRW